MNVENSQFANNDQLYNFLDFGFSTTTGEGQDLISDETGYSLLSSTAYTESLRRVTERGNSDITHYYNRSCGNLGGSEVATFTTTTSGCDGSYTELRLKGSSTVYPVARTWACNYIDKASYEGKCLEIVVEGGGSSQGASSVCDQDQDVDIGDMSRQFRDSEANAENNGYTFTCANSPYYRVTQIEIAIDGLTVFVQRGSDLETCLINRDGLTYDELRWVFSDMTKSEIESDGGDLDDIDDGQGDGKKRWNQLSASCPDDEIVIYGAGDDSGTQDFFTSEIFGDDDDEYFYSSSSSSYTLSEDDDVITDGVASDSSGVGFVGYAHYLQEISSLYAISLSSGSSNYIEPSSETINDGTYPLSRKIYMNVKQSQWDEAYGFIAFGFEDIGQEIIEQEIGYVTLDETTYTVNKVRLNSSVYDDLGSAPESATGDDDSGLTDGLIAGIVIACVVIVILIIVIIWFTRKYKGGRYVFNDEKDADIGNNTAGGSQTAGLNANNEDDDL